MRELRRRQLLTGAAVSGAALASGVITPAMARTADPAAATPKEDCAPPFGPVSFGPGDPRYDSLVTGHNLRFTGTPDTVTVAGSAEQVRKAVGDAVAAGRRIAVRAGGHCLEDFTASAEIKALIDLSQLTDVYYDGQRRAFAVEPGAKLGKVYSTLFTGWGVTIPGGTCPDVGAGGHFAGGGYGLLSRRYGLVVDHIYAVEVVVVDKSGKARIVVATREAGDPNRDLWWAHTGGGGGNFGVVTRYWLRSPTATGSDPTRLMPKAPSSMRHRLVTLPWDAMTEAAFSRLLRNWCDWCEKNSAPDSPNAQIWASFTGSHKAAGALSFIVGGGTDVPNGEKLMADHVAQIMAGVGVKPGSDISGAAPFLAESNWVAEAAGRSKDKSADLHKGFTDAQIATIYGKLTQAGFADPAAMLSLTAYGCRVNAVASDATATAGRDSVLRAYFSPGIWDAPADDAAHIAWVREFYRDVFAVTGGVPAPGPVTSGSYINYPDTDLADPKWNASGVPWSTLYYRDNYARLRQIKSRYDPRNAFHHALSIEPAG